MIRLEKVNKYFNRRKANEIHVINNTSLDFPETGIVALLGPSGCGKTTLLNVIGGLDRVGSGKIYIDKDCITSKGSNKIDDLRNAKIGYIFQNFNLLDDRTVFENVAIALRMIGIKDKKVIEDRVNYCLESVGIYQYRHKNADTLSGGQRQRVAIARAIVKNPRIIIADEPTGNLDSSNTLEVMNIIKTISRERLVILVTHEKKIAEFYSERVIEMKDGKVLNDRVNDSSKYLDYQLENKIYLKDIPCVKKFSQDDVKVDVYSDTERAADIKMVIRGGNLYINTDGMFNVVDENTNIEMIDDHYSMIDSSIYEENRFKYDKYLPENYKAKYTSLYTPLNMLGNGFKTVHGFKKMKKLLLVGFVFAAMFAFLAVSNIAGIFNIEEKDFLTTNDHYVTVSNTNHSESFMNEIAAIKGSRYVLPGNTVAHLTLPMNDYYQTAAASADLKGSITYTSTITKKDLYAGKMPANDHEIVVDKMLIDKFLYDKKGKETGIVKTKQFIGRTVTVPNLEDYTIVGISDTNSPSIYVDENQAMYILTNAQSDTSSEAQDSSGESSSGDTASTAQASTILDYTLAPSALKIKKGRAPKNTYETVANYSHYMEYELNKTIDKKVNGRKLTVVGFYTSDTLNDNYYVTSETIKVGYMSKQKEISVYSDHPKALISKLHDKNISSAVNYDRDKTKYVEQRNKSSRSQLIAAAVIMVIALIEMFLMLRSSFLSRIKEVGTMRAIGLKKKDIYRMFAGEIVAITLITSIPGIILMFYILKNVIKITSYLAGMYLVTVPVAIATFVMLLVFNLIAGLIPVARTMSKRPAEILSRTDI